MTPRKLLCVTLKTVAARANGKGQRDQHLQPLRLRCQEREGGPLLVERAQMEQLATPCRHFPMVTSMGKKLQRPPPLAKMTMRWNLHHHHLQ